MDTAPVGSAAVASSRPREAPEARLLRHGSAQPVRRETKCKKLAAKPPNGLFWEDKLSHRLAHITRPSPIALGDHRCALRTRDARSKIVHDIMISSWKHELLGVDTNSNPKTLDIVVEESAHLCPVCRSESELSNEVR